MKRIIPIGHFWVIAALYFLRILSVICFFSFLVWAVLAQEMLAIYCMGVAVVALVFAGLGKMILSRNVLCPLCRAELFAKKNCSRNERSVRLFGSYRFPMAFAILRFASRLRCNFCGTSFRFIGKSRQGEDKVSKETTAWRS